MGNHFLKKIAVSILTILMLMGLIRGMGFSQDNKNSKQKHRGNSQTLTAEQTALIKTILSKYNASTLTADEAKAIHEKFREAGIHAGPESKDAIIAAGFDPEKLRTLAPPQIHDRKEEIIPPTIEERLIIVENKIIKPLSLNTVQKEKVNTAFKDFYTEMDKLMDHPSKTHSMPEESKVEALVKIRNDKVKQAIPDTLFPKYLEFEEATHPKKPVEGRGRSK